jgi:hypothetical protein
MFCLLFRGKNVCIYHILDSCKFGAAHCVYSHSKGALPERGWWNSPEKVAKVKDVLELAERNAKEQRQVERRAYIKEMRSEVRTRHALEKRATEVGQPLSSADAEKRNVARKARKAAVDASDVKDDVKKGVEGKEQIGVMGGVEKNTGKTTIAGATEHSTTTSKKAKARREGTKEIEGQSGHQKIAEGGANGDASATPTTPSGKKGAQNRHHYRRKKSKTGSVPASVAVTEGGS